MAALTCYTAPGVVFEDETAMKEHYKSEWHRHNLKRKVAGLPPLGYEAYEERTGGAAAAGGAAPPGHGSTSLGGGPPPEGMTRKQERFLKREAHQQEKHAKAAANPKTKSAHYEKIKTMTEHEFIEHKMASDLGAIYRYLTGEK